MSRSKTPERGKRMKPIKKVSRIDSKVILIWFIGLILSFIEYNSQNQTIPFIKVSLYIVLTFMGMYVESQR